MPRILIVDDDPHIRSSLRRALEQEGYEVDDCGDSDLAPERAVSFAPDVVILDVMMPGIDGLEVCRRIRERSAVAVLMLTARVGIPDRVQGLDAGADDYLTKPFALSELRARVRALLRRRDPHAGPRVHQVADLIIDERSREVRRGSRVIALSPREFELLLVLAENAGTVIAESTLLELLWGYTEASNVAAVHISNLRRKLEEGGEVRLLHTVRGHGYVLRAPES